MRVTEVIQQMFALSNELERQYPGRHFTPDGHMLGSIGEVYAKEMYGLELYEANHKIHDAYDKEGRKIQIKITQRDRIALTSMPEYLIVFRVDQSGSIEEIYNGPGNIPWDLCGKLQKNGQRSIRLSTLRNIRVQPEDWIKRYSDSER